MKTRVRYRLLALCMAVFLICPLISVSAFAEEGDASSDIQYENTENGADTQDAESDTAESDAAEPDVPESLVVKIPVTKKIDYHPTGSTKVESTFTFQIAPGSDDAKAKLPEKTTLDITTDQAKTDYFEIAYTEPGTYSYQVNEIAGTEKGFAYNNGYFRIWIEIVQDDAGNLVVDEENSFYGLPTDRYPLFTEEGLVFINNYYNCDPVTITIPVEKEIVPAKAGGEMPKEDGTFTLTIEQTNSGADALDHSPEETSVVLKTASSDKGQFGPMTFYATGIYVFSIKEAAGGDSAYEYDETVHSIDVLVSFNEAQGVLQVDHVMDYHEGSPEGDILFLSEGTDPIPDVTTLSVKFTNKYTAPEEPKDDSKDEEPKDESKVEDPKDNSKVEDPKDNSKVEDPKDNSKVEEPKDNSKVEDPKDDSKKNDDKKSDEKPKDDKNSKAATTAVKTGDQSQAALWIVIALIAVVTAAVILVRRRNR